MKTIEELEHLVALAEGGELSNMEIDILLQQARQISHGVEEEDAGDWHHNIVRLGEILEERRA